MRYHGKYCGPHWSAGEHQDSVLSSVPPLDEFDSTCKEHDAAYAVAGDLEGADYRFAATNLASGAPKRVLAGVLVGAQAVGRTADRLATYLMNSKSNNSLRGSARRQKAQSINTTKSGNDVSRAAPVAVSTRRTGASARISPRAAGVTVSHRTFLGPVTNGLAFTPTSYATNPGLASTFPWLSKIASRYDKYRFTRLRFEYRSVAATSTSGVAMMSFDYNALDPLPSSKLIQSQTIPNAENNVWVNNDLVVPTDNAWRFVRQGTVANSDLKTYDLGNMVLSTIYGNGAITGELYVEYTVELEKPSEPDAFASRITSNNPAAASVPFVSPTITGVPAFTVFPGSLRMEVAGTYLFTLVVNGTAISSIVAPIATGATVNSLGSSVINPASTRGMYVVSVTCNKGDTISFATSITAGAVQDVNLYTCEYFV